MKEIKQIKTIFSGDGYISVSDVIDQRRVEFSIFEKNKNQQLYFEMDLDSLWDFNARLTMYLSNKGYRCGV